MQNKISQTVIDHIKPTIEQAGLMLWDVEYHPGSNAMLTILLDKPGKDENISMEEVSDISQVISEQLDQIQPDPFDDTYMLDIASPGVFRTLSTPEHFEWARQMPILIGLYQKINGAKQVEGVLKDFDDKKIIIETPDGPLEISFDQITKIQLNQEV